MATATIFLKNLKSRAVLALCCLQLKMALYSLIGCTFNKQEFFVASALAVPRSVASKFQQRTCINPTVYGKVGPYYSRPVLNVFYAYAFSNFCLG